MEGRHTLTMADLIASVGVHRFFASVAAGFPFHTRRALALGHLHANSEFCRGAALTGAHNKFN